MTPHRMFLTTALLAAGLFVAACGGTTPSGAASTTQPSTVDAAPTAIVTVPVAIAATSATPSPATPTASPAIATSPTTAGTITSVASPTATASTSTNASAAAGAIRYDVVPTGSKANYRVREQLVRLTLPSDAVGTTNGVTGDIVIGSDGKVDPTQSKLVVDLTALQSDSSMRDGFISRGTLNISQYPTATFIPTSIEGLTAPLPTSGTQSFKLNGNLTVHGVTKPVTFDVTTQVNARDVTGLATTSFTFETFGMSPPRAGAVASVVDNVKLEVTLHLAQSA